MYRVMLLELWLKAKVILQFLDKIILKVSSAMLMEHLLHDDVGGKCNVCEMDRKM
jgi:hypothetical protein